MSNNNEIKSESMVLNGITVKRDDYNSLKEIIGYGLEAFTPNDWIYLLENDKLPEPYFGFINWDKISGKFNSEETITKYADRINWMVLSRYADYKNFSLNFIREHQEKFHWIYLSSMYPLSFEFLEEFKTKLFWSTLSMNSSLTIEMIQTYKELLDWDEISVYQDLTYEFILENIDKLDLDCVLNRKNQLLTKEQKDDLYRIKKLKQMFR